MRRVCTLAALTAVALLTSAGRASAAHANANHAPPRDSGSVAVASVTGLSIVPADGRAEVVVSVSGAVALQDFMLESPHRVVLDISGARLGMSASMYDRIARGGITNVRVAQYKADVVRLVLDLDGPAEYSVVRADSDVRISLETGATSFASWHSGGGSMNVSAGAVVKAEPVAAVAPASAPVALRGQQSQQQRITVTYQDADIRDVLAAFAAFSGRTIVVGKEVSGTITAEIKDQPWDVALQAILQAQGLAASEEATGIITVDSYSNILTKQASEPLTTQLISINYASAASLIGTVSSLLSKDCPPAGTSTGGAPGQQGGTPQCLTRGSISADSGTNTLLVTEVTSRIPDLLRYIKDLDVRTPQVSLHAKIISVNRTQTEQLGVAYDLGTRGTFFNTLAPRILPGQSAPSTFESQIELGGDALAGISNANRKYRTGAALNLIFSTALGKYSLTSFLDALKESNLADLQAEPSIVTLDNRQAEILVGQETPIRVIDAGSAGQVGQPVRANVQFKESGIILRVTPHITNNRQIRMTIHAEQSRLNVVGGDLGFFFDKSRADNQILVNDGETAVIGGLTQTQVIKNRSGIPFLSELPLIGRLFSQTETREEKRDLLVLITPHILDEGEVVRPPSGSGR